MLHQHLCVSVIVQPRAQRQNLHNKLWPDWYWILRECCLVPTILSLVVSYLLWNVILFVAICHNCCY